MGLEPRSMGGDPQSETATAVPVLSEGSLSSNTPHSRPMIRTDGMSEDSACDGSDGALSGWFVPVSVPRASKISIE